MEATDVLGDFEGSYQSYREWSGPSWVNDFDAERFWHMVHAVPDLQGMDHVLLLSRSRHVGWLYATDQTYAGHPAGGYLYDRLPQRDYWERLLQGLG
jgi:hypothetical protein